jgi:xanthine/CO dehydrogenase XdhC/CoxF family maturation factor
VVCAVREIMPELPCWWESGATVGMGTLINIRGSSPREPGASMVALSYGPMGERRGEGMRVFVQSFAPPPRMLVFGAIDYAAAVARIGSFLGIESRSATPGPCSRRPTGFRAPRR